MHIYYGTPSAAFVKWCFKIKRIWHPAKYPLAVLMVLVFVTVLPVAWLLMAAGYIGSAMAGWCGFDFRGDLDGKWR